MKLTKEQIAEMQAKVDGATEGPWPDNNSDQGWHWVGMSRAQLMANRHFIAHSRTDTPALLAHIAEQDKEIAAKDDALKQALSGFEYMSDRINCTAYIRAIKEAINPPNQSTP